MFALAAEKKASTSVKKKEEGRNPTSHLDTKVARIIDVIKVLGRVHVQWVTKTVPVPSNKSDIKTHHSRRETRAIHP